MRFTANSFRNSAFSEPFLKRYRKQKLNFLSGTHWLDEVGDYSGTQRPKYVLESDGSAVINSSHIASQTVTSKKGTATATVSTGQIAVGSGWISEIVLSDGTVYFLEESIGTIIFDVSAGRKDATLTGGATWAIKRDITLTNNANNFGYSVGQSLIPLASSKFATNGIAYWNTNRADTTYNNTEQSMSVTGTETFSFGIFVAGILILGRDYNVKFTAKTTNLFENFASVGGNNNLGTVISNPNLTGSFQNYEFDITASQTNFRIYTQGSTLIGSNFTIDNIQLIDKTTGILSRLESDITKDVLGNNLQFVGRVASDMAFIQSSKGEVGITSDYGQFNFDCTGVTVVSKEGQTTVNINQSNNRLIFTGIGNGSIYHIILSNGLTFPIAEGSGVVSYAENDSTKTLTWFGNFDWSTQDTYHHNITQGFTLSGGVKLPYKINGSYSNPAASYEEGIKLLGNSYGIVSSNIVTGDLLSQDYFDFTCTAARSSLSQTGSAQMIFSYRNSQTDLVQFFLGSTTGATAQYRANDNVLYTIDYADLDNTVFVKYRVYLDVLNKTFSLYVNDVLFETIDLVIDAQTLTSSIFSIGRLFSGTGTGTAKFYGIIKDIYISTAANSANFELKETADLIAYDKDSISKTITFVTVDWLYRRIAAMGHNQAETKFKQDVFREDFGESSLHFDQSDLSSKVITYADIANTANVFVNQFPNVKINLETFSPVGIINQSNRQNNGLRRNKDTFFGNNK